MGRPGVHGRQARPRYGRLGAAVTSLAVTAVAVLGGTGLLPTAAEQPPTREALTTAAARAEAPVGVPAAQSTPERLETLRDRGPQREIGPAELLPADSGTGRRAVFSEGQQRVWLVGARGGVRRTYLVSGSLSDNLDPGTYQVYSRSLHAIGIDDSGTMKYFVRFTQGDSGAAIGFHDIPVDDGERVQTAAELGTPTSHGCIRQRTRDARAMWEFAQLGTTVVVTS